MCVNAKHVFNANIIFKIRVANYFNKKILKQFFKLYSVE